MKTIQLLAAAALALPAVAGANVYIERTVTSDGRIVEQRIVDTGPAFGPAAPVDSRIAFGPEPVDSAIHAGATNVADDARAQAVAAAIAREPALEGATVTIAARNGRVSLSGSAQSLEQAHRAEQVARDVAGVTAVSGTLDPQGG